MNKRLRTLIFVIMALLLAGIFVIQFITPKSSYVEEAVTDTKLINELDASAQEALKKYFDIEVKGTDDWKKGVVRNRAKEGSGLKDILSLTAKDESDNKVEGNLDFYGLIIEEESKQVRGMIYQYVTEAPVLELTDEEVKARCEAFLRDKELVPADATVTVEAIQSDDKTPELRMLSIKAGDMAFAVAYNLQWDKVMYFEYVPNAE